MPDPLPLPSPSRPILYGAPAPDGELLPWSWADDRLRQARNYWVVSVRPSGRPHSRPVWGVWLNETFYFSTSRRSHKGRNLAANPEVVIHLESGDEAVIFEGIVEEISEDPANFNAFADAYETKYPGFRPKFNPGEVTYRVVPRQAFAWREADFQSSTTRWQF